MKKIMFNNKYGLTTSVLEGRKTMTRRIINGDYEDVKAYHANGGWHFIADTKDGDSFEIKPAYEVGETIAIAQSYEQIYLGFSEPRMRHYFGMRVSAVHHTGDLHNIAGWTNKMFVKSNLMPNRIQITNVKFEKLRDISSEDCLREGIEARVTGCHTFYYIHGEERPYNFPKQAFAALIDKISGKGTWVSNPWVFAYEFELIK